VATSTFFVLINSFFNYTVWPKLAHIVNPVTLMSIQLEVTQFAQIAELFWKKMQLYQRLQFKKMLMDHHLWWDNLSHLKVSSS